jgi:hypothetical protein
MNKRIFSFTFLVIGILSFNAMSAVNASTVPDPFQRFDEKSRLTIDYTDLNSLLDTVVLYTGRSDRKKASYSQGKTGTRMKVSINRSTINEGNRFYFEVFEDSEENQQTLRKIKNRLENIPAMTPLERFNRDEQLAYWINLYNITMLVEVAKVYPEYEFDELLLGDDSILNRKTLMVAGVPLSLNDIQFTILRQNYGNSPLVIYGLFQGVIGGPNIRKSAYTGQYVYADLIDNALDFINSNRGTESKNKRVFRVSSLYQRNAVFFEDFDADLKEHLLTYLEGDEKAELQAATTIKADINDWTIPDLYGSTRDVAGSFANSNAALVGAVTGGNSSRLTSKATLSTRYNPAVLDHLNELNKKREAEARAQSGVVTVEEMGQDPDVAEAAESKDNSDTR